MSWLKKKSVLVPIDFSEVSYQAVGPAKEYVDEVSSLKLIHVLAPLHPADPAAIWGTISDDERKHKVHEFLSKKLSEMVYEGVQIEVAIGDPVTKIIDYAKQVDADLIVVSSHERKEISRLLLGSVAERVVHLAPCPVLILK